MITQKGVSTRGCLKMESAQSDPDILASMTRQELHHVCCQLQRMKIILNDSVNVALEPCEICSDWWAKVERGSKYPIPPGGDLMKVGNVELTFELIANLLQDFEILYRENKHQQMHCHILQNT